MAHQDDSNTWLGIAVAVGMVWYMLKTKTGQPQQPQSQPQSQPEVAVFKPQVIIPTRVPPRVAVIPESIRVIDPNTGMLMVPESRTSTPLQVDPHDGYTLNPAGGRMTILDPNHGTQMVDWDRV